MGLQEKWYLNNDFFLILYITTFIAHYSPEMLKIMSSPQLFLMVDAEPKDV